MSALALRFAWRELRGGLRGFGVFVACIALGVMAIAGVGSVAKSLSDGLSSAGRVILGGDLAFSLVQREASDEEQAFLGAHGVFSVAATLPTMARTDDGRAALVEIKAVDGAYPLFGAVATNPAMPPPELFARQGRRVRRRGRSGPPEPARSQARRPHRDRQCGDRAARRAHGRAGQARRRDRLRPARPHQRGGAARERPAAARQPRALAIPAAATADREASDGAVASVEKAARSAFPDAGWDIRTRSKASPQLERNVERFSQYLTLVALTALLVGGVGVANAVASHLARKRDAIGTMKALGATGAGVFAVYCTQIVLVALFATLLGAVLGAALPFVIAKAFGSLIPLPVAPSLIRARSSCRSPTACSRLSPLPCGRSDGPMTFRCRCCSATRSPPSDAGRDAATSSPPYRSSPRWRRWRFCSLMTIALRRSSWPPPRSFSSRYASSPCW